MKIRLLGAAALALALPVALAVATPSIAAPAATVTVKGHILSPTGRAVAGVRVEVQAKGQADGSLGAAHGFTSKTGRYELHVPPPTTGPDTAKTYVLTVTDPGDADADMADGEWAPTSATFAATGTVFVRNAVVHHGAKLSGRIYDRTGHRVKAGLSVTVGSATTTTRSDGSYHLTNLPAGTVTVRVASPSSNGVARYYTGSTSQGTIDGAKATELDLSYGEKTTGRSIHFPAVAKITGRVLIDGTEESGEGSRTVTAALLDSTGKELASSPASSKFYFRDLAAGTYFLQFSGAASAPAAVVPEYYKDSATLVGATAIVVPTGGAVSGIVADVAAK